MGSALACPTPRASLRFMLFTLSRSERGSPFNSQAPPPFLSLSPNNPASTSMTSLVPELLTFNLSSHFSAAPTDNPFFQYGLRCLPLLQNYQGSVQPHMSLYPTPSWINSHPDNAGEIPSFKVFESDKVFAFLDIQPLSRGHAVGSRHFCLFPAPRC